MLIAARARLTRPSIQNCQGLYRSSPGSSLLAVLKVTGSKSDHSRAVPCSLAPTTYRLLPACAAKYGVSCPIKNIQLIGNCNTGVYMLCHMTEMVRG